MHKRQQLLLRVGDFIRRIRATLAVDVETADEPWSGVWLSRPFEGTLHLTGAEAQDYRKLLRDLRDEFAKEEDLSINSVSQILGDTLFETLDIPSRRSVDFDARLRSALQTLRQRLSTKPTTYTCFVPVDGLDLDGRPLLLGRVRFVRFGRSHLRQLMKGSQEFGNNPARAIVISKSEVVLGENCAVIHVQARDFAAASVLAVRETRRTVDLLNFFSDLIPYNDGWVYLRGEAASLHQSIPILRDDGVASVGHSRAGPLSLFSVKKLRETRHLVRVYRSLHRLALGPCGTAGRVVLAAVQWAGRATVEVKREQSFLLYAIALETAMLPDSDPRELSYRLRLQTAHLLGSSTEERHRIYEEVGRLYQVRSKIVHSGSYNVTDAAWGNIRQLTKRALVRLLLRPSIGVVSREQLANSFERRIVA